MLIEEQNGNFAKPVLPAVPSSVVYNEDCLEALKRFPDNYFDLAIVDPPYDFSIGNKTNFYVSQGKYNKVQETRPKGGFKIGGNYMDSIEKAPNEEYFKELFRVSKNQIVWGANYFTKQLPVIKNYIFWHKKGQSVDDKFNDGEMAFASLGRTRMIDIWWNGVGVINSGENKIHPTQKPVKLYKWILENYAKKDWKILDTHLGSGSIAIACWDMGYDLTAYEVDKEYYDNACKRLETHKAQLTLW